MNFDRLMWLIVGFVFFHTGFHILGVGTIEGGVATLLIGFSGYIVLSGVGSDIDDLKYVDKTYECIAHEMVAQRCLDQLTMEEKSEAMAQAREDVEENLGEEFDMEYNWDEDKLRDSL